MPVAKLILPAPPLESPILPLLTAAVAVGKVCGAEIPKIGIRSEPSNAATTTCAVFEGMVKEARLVTVSNSCNPSTQRMDESSNLEKVFHKWKVWVTSAYYFGLKSGIRLGSNLPPRMSNLTE